MATSHLIVDSDVVVDFLRRQSDALLDALVHFNCHLTAVTVYEIEVAAIRSERQAQRVANLQVITPAELAALY